MKLPKYKPLSPSEKAQISRELKEWCDAPFGKGQPGYETLTYDLADYNRDTLELLEQKKNAINQQNQKIHDEIPGRCWMCKSRAYKICSISQKDCKDTSPDCRTFNGGTSHMIVGCES